MQIAGYLKTSLIEWSGKICSVLFTPGCNFRCPFCHNPDLVDPQKIDKNILKDEEEIIKDLEERKKWIDAVVITGGEPTLQSDLHDFLKKIKIMGFLTMMHTNGTRPEIIKELVHCRLVDYICMDLKGDFENYSRFNGAEVDMEKIKESVKLISESGLEFEFRTTVVPTLHDLPNLLKLARQLQSIINNPQWFLQQFQALNCFDPKFKKLKSYSKEELETFQKELQKIIPNIYLRGV
jgi:pyruvate formate lyase activating enzyme